MLTEQQVFDKVVSRLMDGTGCATENGGGCLYLTKDGMKCAVGIFLPDNKEMQNFNGPLPVLIREFEYHPGFPKEIIEYKNLMYDLQIVHDDEYCWEGKEFVGFDKLKAVAVDYKLEYKDVN